jgi:putative ABC transport system permease protein
MNLLLDLRYGLRRLRNSPGFTVLATLCLGIGIGASVGVFSILHTLVLRPLPEVSAPWELVALTPKPVPVPGMPGATMYMMLSYPSYLQYRDQSRVFSDLVGYEKIPVSLAVPGEGRPLRVSGHVATANYFSALGVRAARGRTLEQERGTAERQNGVVISEGLWRRVFGGRQDVLGRPLLLNGRVFQVVGVLQEGFRGVERTAPVDLWVAAEAAARVMPSMKEGDLGDPGKAWINNFFARLAPGVSVVKAQAEIDAVARRLPKTARLEPPGLEISEGVGIDPLLRKGIFDPLLLVAGVIALLMLLVCANLAGLLLSQAVAREREIGVRVALGATQGRILQQLLSEGVLLGLLGGGVGVAIGRALMTSLEGVALDGFLPRLSGLSLDAQALSFALGLAMAAGLLFGLAPAVWASQARWIREGMATTPRRSWLQDAFVVGQIALSLILLVGTGLFVRTWRNLQEIPPGFDGRGVINFELDLESQRYTEPAARVFYERLLESARRVPGVRSAALAMMVPLKGEEGAMFFNRLQTEGSTGEPRMTEMNLISSDYFKTLGIPLLAGRDFSPRDRKGAPGVLIVSQRLAKSLWPGKNPVGQRVTMGKESLEVIGVVGDIRRSLEGEPLDIVYRSGQQEEFANLTLHVKTGGDPRAAMAAIRAEISRLDRNLPVAEVSFFDQLIQRASAQPRLFSQLLGSTSGVALLLTGIGLYGTLAFAVRRRTREMGVRRALGAGTSGILGLVLRRGLALTGIGLAVGIAVSLLVTRALATLLFGVTPTDPVVFLTVALICGALGVAASLLPAWSAARVSPMEALRQE